MPFLNILKKALSLFHFLQVAKLLSCVSSSSEVVEASTMHNIRRTNDGRYSNTNDDCDKGHDHCDDDGTNHSQI